MILATSLFFICQQFVGGWSHSTPHTDAQLIAAIEKTVARGEALNSAATIEGDKFWGWYDIHDFATLPETKSWIFFQHKIVADQDQKLPIRLGSDDGITVWLNGQVLLNHQSERGNNPSAEHIILPLEKGDNLLTIKIYNAGGACSFAINGEKAASPIDVDRAIRRGANFLIAQQMVDGSWGNHSASYRNGATALAVYTLLVSGIDPQTAAVQKGLSYLSAAYPEKTYSASCQLMALAELNNPAYYDQMEVIASDLMSWQEQNGSWAYPEGSWDLSCLQFALLGLRAATLVGIDVPAKIWRNATNGIILCASEPKGSFSDISTAFVYRPNGTETMSMTAAAMSSFEICRQQLGGKYPQKTRKVITRLAAEGIKWMANNFSVSQNPGFGSSRHYYTLYGLERVGSLLGIDLIGDHDWYNHGTNFLLDEQNSNGGWPSTTASAIDTMYALLFLKRATASAAITGNTDTSSAFEEVSADEEGRLRLHVNHGDPVVMWTSPPEGTNPDSVSYHIKREGNGNWQHIGDSSGNRFAYSYVFNSPGKWLVRATAAIDGEDLSSTDVEYQYVPNLRPDDTSYGDDEFENLIPICRPSYEVSSRNATYFDGDKLIDGRFGTRWMTTANDPQPEFTISLRRTAKANRILFSHTYTSPSQCGDGARPSEVLLYINKEDQPIVIPIKYDPTQKTIYTFDKKQKIKKMRVVISKVVNGTLGSSVIGFSQVELQ